MNGISKNSGDAGVNGSALLESNRSNSISVSVWLDRSAVRVAVRESDTSPIKISDVMIGPF
jgi:flagellar biosynthesis regulator FlaF